MVRGIHQKAPPLQRITYLDSHGAISLIFLKQREYCIKKRIQGKTQYISIEPQPLANQIVAVYRYYTVLKLDMSDKNVTRLGDGGLKSALAIVEYIGKFPGLAPHGNSRQIESEYIRTPSYVDHGRHRRHATEDRTKTSI